MARTVDGMKIFITDSSIAQEAVTLLEKHGCQYEFWHESDSRSQLVDKITGWQPEGLIVRKGNINRTILRASNELRVICKHGVGIDNIDIDEATAMRIPVLITASANFESVAEHTLGLMLAMLRMIPKQNDYVRCGGWKKDEYKGEDLFGKTLGIIGLGRIGRRLVEIVNPFEMEILVYDPQVPHSSVPTDIQKVTSLQDMLPFIDILSIHCPLTDETEKMIGKNELEALKEGAWIVNTARGRVIDETELLKSLRSGKIRGAALDTLEQEPPEPSNPLLSLENVIVTNHIGGSSIEAIRKMATNAVELVIDGLNGIWPDRSHIVNPEILDTTKQHYQA